MHSTSFSSMTRTGAFSVAVLICVHARSSCPEKRWNEAKSMKPKRCEPCCIMLDLASSLLGREPKVSMIRSTASVQPAGRLEAMPEAREGWAEKDGTESDSDDGREPLTSGSLPGQPSALHPDLLRLSRRWVVETIAMLPNV